MVTDRVQKILAHKSFQHQMELIRLDKKAEDTSLSSNMLLLDNTPQMRGMNTLLLDPEQDKEEFIFYFNRIATLLVEKAVAQVQTEPIQIWTPLGIPYVGARVVGEVRCWALPTHRLHSSGQVR